jgi:hypothetical protein
MKAELVNINKVRTNPNNPRIIKDEKFAKLVKSIQEFPQMLEIRPIVVNDDMIVLGGNMRLKACLEAGLKEIPIIKASNLTEEQQKEFIIKDNVGFGEWDWNDLANNWDAEQLETWGLDIPGWTNNLDINSMTEEMLNLDEQFDVIGNKKDNQKVVLIFNNKEDAESWLNSKSIPFKKNSMVWEVDMSTPST